MQKNELTYSEWALPILIYLFSGKLWKWLWCNLLSEWQFQCNLKWNNLLL